MKLAICAGPATTGKTAVLRHVIRKLLAAGDQVLITIDAIGSLTNHVVVV